jgi:hypothetical protein
MCDNWKVGCRWHVTVDGIVWSREETDLAAIATEMEDTTNFLRGAGTVGSPTFEQFDKGPGGRITFTSQVAKCTGWDMMFAYEGIEDWDASIVFPIDEFDPAFYSNAAALPLQPLPPFTPSFPDAYQQRTLHYQSSLHSGELNFVRNCDETWRPYCGVRYIRFDDEIDDAFRQDAQFPLPFPGSQPVGTFLAGATSDQVDSFDIDNNLMGFQIGLLHDTWRVTRRFAIEGFINSGVYYNKIKYHNQVSVVTTQIVADDVLTVAVNEARVDTSQAVINDDRDYSEIAYVSEANLTGVCRLNKCWALRGGYQVLWINNVHLADDAYLGNENINRGLLFHGWHCGVECRR